MDIFTVFYCLNIMASILILMWPLWFSVNKLLLPMINPMTIIFAAMLPVEFMKLFIGPYYLLENGLFDYGYQFALLMNNFYTLSMVVGLLTFLNFFKKIRIDRLIDWNRIISIGSLRTCEYLFLIIFFIALYLLASSEFGLVNWILNPREGYQHYRFANGHLYALAMNFLGAAFILSLAQKPSPIKVVFKCITYTLLGYFLGSKGYLLGIFIATAIFLWFLNWKYLTNFFTFALPAFLLLMLFNLYLAMGDDFGINVIAEYFDHYKNAAMYYDAQSRGEIPLYYGDIFLSSFWAYVPRAFYAAKPFSYGILLVNDIFYPGQSELSNTPAFAGAVEQFADFGFLGVILFGFFSAQGFSTALLSYFTFIKPRISLSNISFYSLIILIVQYAPGFGSFLPGLLYVVFLCFVMLLIRICSLRMYPA